MLLTFVRELGQGGFGRVFLARDEASGAHVAVKELRLREEADRERFAREIRLLEEQSANPHVIDIYTHELHATPPYFVMEYCELGSLRGWVGNANWRDVAKAIFHAAKGLSGIHSAGGFHRDVKPDNLLVARKPNGAWLVKVADFGLARRPWSQSTMTRTPGGTPGYMAPELSVPDAEYTASADVYSLGVTAIELLIGSRLNVRDRLRSALAPLAVKSLFARMASISPARRPPMSNVVAELKRLLSPATRRRPQAKRPDNVGWWVVAGLGAAMVLAGSGSNDWDPVVERYRGADGRFRSG